MTRAICPCPTEPRSSGCRCFQRESVSYLAQCTEHLGQMLNFATLTKHPMRQRLLRLLVQDQRLFALQLFAAHLRFVLRCNTWPLHCLSCRSLWTGGDFVSKSARFPGDVHVPTMTSPGFTNCCSQRTCVDKCRMVQAPSHRHKSRAAALSSNSSVRTSSPMNNKTARINSVSQVADAAA